MKRTVLLTLIAVFTCLNLINAQQDSTTVQKNNLEETASIGLGMGQDFGGFGANLLVYPQKNIGIFGGAGYAVAGTGYNIGTKVRFFSQKNTRTNFFMTAMYGYNAAVKVSGAKEYNKLFYGPTIGFGIDTGKRSYKTGYWTMALLIPLRAAEVDNYMDELENDYGVEFKSGLFPVSFSIGYRFGL